MSLWRYGRVCIQFRSSGLVPFQRSRREDMLTELSRREKVGNIKPDADIDTFMKACAMRGQEANMISDYVLKVLGLEICADTMVGDEMLRGISGGQRKHVTTDGHDNPLSLLGRVSPAVIQWT